MWDDLESDESQLDNLNKVTNSYDKFSDKNFNNELIDDNIEDSDEKFMNLLREIYSKGDDETKRAMILAPSQIGEDPDLKFGDSVASITDTSISAYKEPENPVPIVSEAAQEVFSLFTHTFHLLQTIFRFWTSYLI
uniref:SGS domain containing protein, putative n=1 Tax=Theileria annulata TaxID=5874 RepID=A0A3B0NKN0_THEAN